MVNWDGLFLITSLIIASKGLELSGVFTSLAIRLAKDSVRKIFIRLALLTAFSSTFIMNDTAVLVFTPLVVSLGRIADVNVPRLVTLVAISANVGSSLTPMGNPQNIIIWRYYRLGILEFIKGMLPFTLAWLLIVLGFAWLEESKVKILEVPGVEIRKDLFLASIFLLVLDVLLGKFDMSLWGLVATLALFLVVDRNVLLSFDVALIPTFALIFSNFAEISELVKLNVAGYGSTFLVSLFITQFISNVPATAILVHSNVPWLPLSLGVNLGGNGTVISSLANLIAIRISGLRWRDFHRYSIPYFVAATLVTFIVLLIAS
ncbi:hypothetical protein PNA2_0276 [Pyrococcus sp. NA2]|nr:hypothetical protein PNA2_0276 [Pyrococcus sp. NA2]